MMSQHLSGTLRTCILLLLAICGGFSILEGAIYKTICVSPTGNDTNTGDSWSQAKASLVGARDKVRSLNTAMSGDILVLFAGGSYYLDATARFDERDSGKNGWKVIYQNNTNQLPVFRGAQSISQWKDAPWGGWIMNQNPLTFSFRQLWVNSKKAVMARTPNRGTYFPHDMTIYTNNQTLVISLANLPVWSPQHPVEIVFQGKWTEHIGRIETVVTQGNQAILTLRSNERKDIFNVIKNQIDNNDKHSYYFQNSGNFLDASGEFFLEAGNLYYKTRAGETKSNTVAMVPQLTTLLSLKGSSPSAKIKNLVFSGLDFSETTWNEPTDHGFADGQGASYVVDGKGTLPPSAVLVAYADSVDFYQCRFIRLGTSGLCLAKAVSGSFVEGCRFEDIAGDGVEIYTAAIVEGGNAYSNANLFCIYNRVVNCYFNACGNDYPGSIPVFGMFGRYNVVAQNEIANAPYTGISWGWGWGGQPGSPLEGNVISHNIIHNVVNTLADGAGIYTLENQKDSVNGLTVFENWLFNIRKGLYAHTPSPICGIYFDEGTKHVVAQHNVISNVDVFKGDVIFNHSGASLESNDLIVLNAYTQDAIVRNHAGLQDDFNITNWGPLPAYPASFNVIRNKISWASNGSYAEAYHVDRGMDDDTNTIWAAAGGTIGIYMTCLMRSTAITRVEIKARPDVDQPFARNNFVVEGSMDGSTWTTLATQGSASFAHQGTWSSPVTNTTAWLYVRVRKTDGAHFNFAEFRAFGR